MTQSSLARIAIPAYTPAAGRVRSSVGDGFSVPEHYVHAIHRAGGVPILLSALDSRSPAAILTDFEGLMLIGGGDITPSLYAALEHPDSYGIEYERDRFEITLVRTAIEQRVPVLAICRGMQIVNVALGGSLIQHMPDLPGTIPHRARDKSRVFHDVRVEDETLISRICGRKLTNCSSRHHQGVDVTAEDLKPSAWAPDGTVEALELRHPRAWFLAVQWHPEETAGADPAQQNLFDSFVAACQMGDSRLQMVANRL